MRLMKTAGSQETAKSAIRFSQQSAGDFSLGIITLDNPRALNALDLEMLRAVADKLLEWRDQRSIACIVLHAESEKAFSAGGDVKSLMAALKRDGAMPVALEYFTTEYFADYLIHIYPKPILCWADGIVMGGGIGIMNGASYRVVTERSILAMPEITIGLYPDVGATYFLNRAPSGIGLFLGLTGARFNGHDAVAIGMADGLIPSQKILHGAAWPLVFSTRAGLPAATDRSGRSLTTTLPAPTTHCRPTFAITRAPFPIHVSQPIWIRLNSPR